MALGNRDAGTDIAWTRFHRYPNEDTLNSLLNMIGEDQRDQVIAGETRRILASHTLSYANAAFLLKMQRIDEAERYLLDRADQLNGDLYGTLLPLAESMEKAGRFLLASLIYRALHAASPRSVTLTQLRFASFAVINLRRDFHPQECAHAGRTSKKPNREWVGLG